MANLDFANAINAGMEVLGRDTDPAKFRKAVAETLRTLPEGATQQLLKEKRQPDESWRETVAREFEQS